MKRLKLLLGLPLLLLFSASFLGCYEIYRGYGEITSASPNPDELTYLESGEEIEFSVNVNASPDHRIKWSVKHDYKNQDYISDTFKFTYNPEQHSNKIIVYCELEVLHSWFGLSLDFGLGFHSEWILEDDLEWEIRITQEPPTWYGNYKIEDSTDLQALNGFTEITGNLRIGGPDYFSLSNIGNLEDLSNLTTIGGSLEIEDNWYLQSLDGLSNLTSIGGSLRISQNDLTSLDGLSNLTSIGGSLRISENDLTSLEGLSSELSSIGGSLIIIDNYRLEDLNMLSNITSLGGGLIINGNASLTALTGLDNITSFGGSLWIKNNTSLTDLTALSNLTSVVGDLSIDGNASLTALTGLDNITSVVGINWYRGGDLSIKNNTSLTALTGLDNITSVGEKLYIGNNDSLTTLTGLDNLTSVGDSLWISGNAALTNLEGLNSLCNVEGYNYIGNSIIIRENPELCTNLADALGDQISGCDPDGIGGIAISDNKICP